MDITFGLVPHLPDPGNRSSFEEICALVSGDVGLTVRPHLASAPAELAASIAAGEVQLAWISPTLLLLSDALRHVVPLLSSVRQGVDLYHALLFVAWDSPILAPEGLKGRRAAWVARTSASGYIVSRLSLARRGLDVRSLFASETFHSSHGAAVWAVCEGSADVGATYGVFEQGDSRLPLVKTGYRDFVPGFRARVIDAAGPIPSDMVVAHPAVEFRTRALLAGALCRLATDPIGAPHVQKVIGAEAFRSFGHDSLASLESLVEAARSLPSS